MQERDWGDWLPAPVFLVPGVRNPEGPLQRADFMRGEETEAVGLLALGHVAPPLLYISTGSHTKFIEVDADGRIAWSVTTLGGELLWALHRETILADLVDPGGALADTIRVEEGADSALEVGLSRTLFAARLLHRVGDETPAACSAFIHGAVAMDDLIGLRRTVGERPLARRVAVAGKSALAEALRHLIRRDDWADELHVVDVPLGALGALALHRARNGGDAEEAERSVHA
jgi:2-dehydro-3-deoxygalactonokinase